MEKEAQYNFPIHPKGFYIVFEGIDGCGKSTQLSRLSNWLKAYKSVITVETKEPDKSNFWGKRSYADLNDKSSDSVHVKYRFEFQRWNAMGLARDMAEITLPALENSHIVLKDRSHIVSCVYGSLHAQDVRDYIRKARIFLGEDFFWPDIIFIFDVSVELSLQRLKEKGKEFDEFEKKEVLTHTRSMYQLYAQEYPNCTLINAARSMDDVFLDVKHKFLEKLIENAAPS